MSFQSRRRRAGAALAGLAAGFGAPAALSPAAGAPAAPPREINSQATEMSPRISRCLLQREPGLIDRWLRTLPGSADENRLVADAEPRFSACFGLPYGVNGSIWLPKYDTAGIRSALVRALLQARRDDLPLAPAPAPGAGAPWYSGPPDLPASAQDAAAIVAADLGACLARKHWGGVVAIVKAVDPAAENAFFSASRKYREARRREAATVDSELSKMIPSVPGCVPAGAKLRINRLRLRSLLEETAYQMTSAGRPAFKAR